MATTFALALLTPSVAAAATSWTSLPAPWYAPTQKANLTDAPAYRLHTTSSVDVVGHYAYTVQATLNRLTVVDVSNPSKPTVVGSLQDTAHMDTPTWIVVQGAYAYVASKGRDNTDLAGSSLSIYDVTNPAKPVFAGTVTKDTRLYGAYGLQVVGGHAYVAAQGCVGGTGCASTYPGGNALTVVDVSHPAHPAITGSVSHLPETTHLDSISVVGNRAYGTAFYASRLTSFDVSDPAHPAILGSKSDSTLSFANDVQVQGRYAYAVEQSTSAARLTVVDVSDPAHMAITGSVLDNTRLAYAYRLQVRGRFAYVAAPRANGLAIVDLAHPAAPAVVATITDPVTLANPIGLDVLGDIAYVPAYCPRANGSCDPAQHGSFTTVDVSAFGMTAPDTTITSGPPATTSSGSATFSFSATRRGASFACSLDGAPAKACTSPRSYTGLAAGSHTFTVAATSLAGVVDPSPASRRWSVAAPAPAAPAAAPTSAPPAATPTEAPADPVPTPAAPTPTPTEAVARPTDAVPTPADPVATPTAPAPTLSPAAAAARLICRRGKAAHHRRRVTCRLVTSAARRTKATLKRRGEVVATGTASGRRATLRGAAAALRHPARLTLVLQRRGHRARRLPATLR